MTIDLDEMIRNQSAAASPDSLSGLEAGVWRRIGRHRARAAARRLQLGAVAIAVMIGAIGGGVMLGDEPPADTDLHILTVEAGLAPFGVTGGLG